MKFVEKLKNLIKIYITNSQQDRGISKSRAILPLPNREMEQGDSDAELRAMSEAGRSILQTSCSYCGSQDFVKRGTRQKKSGKTQLYFCKSCLRTFTPAWTKGRQHDWQTILEAMSYYNLGFSLAQTCGIMKKKFNEEIQPSTLSSWMERHKELCSYSRMRPFAIKEFSPRETIETCTLAHRQLYRFRYHRAKTKYIMEDDFKHYKFYPLKEFLENVSTETPHQYFQRPAADVDRPSGSRSLGDQILRASEAPIKFSKTEMIVRSKENYATKLAKLVFQGVEENKARHEALQRFLIANDSVTVATEVPVYIRKEDLQHMQTQLGFKLFLQENKKEMREMENEEIPKLITGHIDFLQIRNGAIHILDYKSNAAKERPIEQLTLYALALSRLTGLRVFHFKCAWFDEKDYFEFFPLHAVYKIRRGRGKVYTKEGEYNMNERADKIEHLGPNVPLPKLPDVKKQEVKAKRN